MEQAQPCARQAFRVHNGIPAAFMPGRAEKGLRAGRGGLLFEPPEEGGWGLGKGLSCQTSPKRLI